MDHSGKSLVIVGCGFPQRSLIETARSLGLHVIGVDFDPNAVGVRMCQEFELISTLDIDAIEKMILRRGIGAVTTTGSEAAVRTVSELAYRLGLPFHIDPQTLRNAQEKDRMRACYAAAGDVAVPPFLSCETLDQATTFVVEHGLPVVLKPVRGWGQRGVSKVISLDELPHAFNHAQREAIHAGAYCVMIESYIEGQEYSVNGWIEDKKLVSYCVTERQTFPGNQPLGVMMAEVAPSGLDPEQQARVVDEAARGARALNLPDGPCYSQVALGPRGCFLFETAARLGGGYDADVTKLVSGVDLYERVIGIALGDPALARAGARHQGFDAALAKFWVGKPGVVRSIEGLEQARQQPGIVELQVFVPIGGKIMPFTDGAKRAACVLATGRSRQGAIAQADRALEILHIAVDGLEVEEPS